jgi:hypothetical protein
MAFSRADLDLLDRTDEIDIETSSRAGQPRRTTIWVVVDDGVPYIRSVRGSAGGWYRQVRVNSDVVLHVDGRRLKAAAVPATDDESVRRVNAALRKKYGNTQSTKAMLQPKTLETTLRLEPAPE